MLADVAVSQSLPSFTVGSCYFVIVNKKLVLLGFLNYFLFLSPLLLPLTTLVLFEPVSLWKPRVGFQDSECDRSLFCHAWLWTTGTVSRVRNLWEEPR